MEETYLLTQGATAFDVPYNVSIDLNNLNYRMSNCSPALTAILPYCWWFVTQGGNWTYLEAALRSFQDSTSVEPQSSVDPILSETLPSISELVGTYATLSPPWNTYKIAPANIPPEIWIEESLRMHEDLLQPEPRKHSPCPFYDRPILFEPRMRRTPKRSSGVAWSGSSSDARIVLNAPLPPVSAEEVENIRKLRRESDLVFLGILFQFDFFHSWTQSPSSSQRPVDAHTTTSNQSQQSKYQSWIASEIGQYRRDSAVLYHLDEQPTYLAVSRICRPTAP
ncbi:hypothetical protein MVEN_00206400 [Mycena venus]|uniref:Uncharacterized protein n=1 Tax=Mycena venus TaxID=2733690 RepID=A0A8H6Z192_9AGAR|nr:hypothetical protein MVEN_00206400 [Mycena venus]